MSLSFLFPYLESYEGSRSEMTINIMYKGTFHCYFGEIENYPFEQQTCSFDIYPFKSVGPFKLVAKNLTYHSCIEPGMQVFAYEIVRWNMESSSASKINLHITHDIVDNWKFFSY